MFLGCGMALSLPPGRTGSPRPGRCAGTGDGWGRPQFWCAGGGSSSAPAATTAAANQGDAAQAEWKWERKVTLVCPWGVGGGADSTLRPLQTVLQDELGVPVEIVNVEGAGGANGIDFTCKQPADGYTYVLGTQACCALSRASCSSVWSWWSSWL